MIDGDVVGTIVHDSPWKVVLDALTIQPPCRMHLARSESILVADHSSMMTSWVWLLIIAAENCRSLVMEAMAFLGMRRWKMLHHDVFPESLGPATTNLFTLCGMLKASRH